MMIDRFQNETIVTAERGKFLKLVDEPENEERFGRPIRIIFSNRKEIPEFKELPIDFEPVMNMPEENIVEPEVILEEKAVEENVPEAIEETEVEEISVKSDKDKKSK